MSDHEFDPRMDDANPVDDELVVNDDLTFPEANEDAFEEVNRYMASEAEAIDGENREFVANAADRINDTFAPPTEAYRPVTLEPTSVEPVEFPAAGPAELLPGQDNTTGGYNTNYTEDAFDAEEDSASDHTTTLPIVSSSTANENTIPYNTPFTPVDFHPTPTQAPEVEGTDTPAAEAAGTGYSTEYAFEDVEDSASDHTTTLPVVSQSTVNEDTVPYDVDASFHGEDEQGEEVGDSVEVPADSLDAPQDTNSDDMSMPEDAAPAEVVSEAVEDIPGAAAFTPFGLQPTPVERPDEVEEEETASPEEAEDAAPAEGEVEAVNDVYAPEDVSDDSSFAPVGSEPTPVKNEDGVGVEDAAEISEGASEFADESVEETPEGGFDEAAVHTDEAEVFEDSVASDEDSEAPSEVSEESAFAPVNFEPTYVETSDEVDAGEDSSVEVPEEASLDSVSTPGGFAAAPVDTADSVDMPEDVDILDGAHTVEDADAVEGFGEADTPATYTPEVTSSETDIHSENIGTATTYYGTSYAAPAEPDTRGDVDENSIFASVGPKPTRLETPDVVELSEMEDASSLEVPEEASLDSVSTPGGFEAAPVDTADSVDVPDAAHTVEDADAVESVDAVEGFGEADTPATYTPEVTSSETDIHSEDTGTATTYYGTSYAAPAEPDTRGDVDENSIFAPTSFHSESTEAADVPETDPVVENFNSSYERATTIPAAQVPDLADSSASTETEVAALAETSGAEDVPADVLENRSEPASMATEDTADDSTSMLRRSLLSPAEAPAPAEPSWQEVPSPEQDTKPGATATPESLENELFEGATVVPEMRSRFWTHWLGIFSAILLVPLTWFILADAGARFTLSETAPASTGVAQLWPSLELFSGIVLAVIIIMLSARSSAGAWVMGTIMTLIGLPWILVPGLTDQLMTPSLEWLKAWNGFGINLAHHLQDSGYSGRMLVIGVGLLALAYVSHTVRRRGRAEEALRIEVERINPAGAHYSWSDRRKAAKAERKAERAAKREAKRTAKKK